MAINTLQFQLGIKNYSGNSLYSIIQKCQKFEIIQGCSHAKHDTKHKDKRLVPFKDILPMIHHQHPTQVFTEFGLFQSFSQEKADYKVGLIN